MLVLAEKNDCLLFWDNFGSDDILNLFINSWRQDPVITLQIIMHCRHNNIHVDAIYKIFDYMAAYMYDSYSLNVSNLIINGNWKDVLHLCKYHKQSGNNYNGVLSMMANVLRNDIKHYYTSNDNFYCLTEVAAYAPTEKSYFNDEAFEIMKILGLTPKCYRKTISMLRKVIASESNLTSPHESTNNDLCDLVWNGVARNNANVTIIFDPNTKSNRELAISMAMVLARSYCNNKLIVGNYTIKLSDNYKDNYNRINGITNNKIERVKENVLIISDKNICYSGKNIIIWNPSDEIVFPHVIKNGIYHIGGVKDFVAKNLFSICDRFELLKNTIVNYSVNVHPNDVIIF